MTKKEKVSPLQELEEEIENLKQEIYDIKMVILQIHKRIGIPIAAAVKPLIVV